MSSIDNRSSPPTNSNNHENNNNGNKNNNNDENLPPTFINGKNNTGGNNNTRRVTPSISEKLAIPPGLVFEVLFNDKRVRQMLKDIGFSVDNDQNNDDVTFLLNSFERAVSEILDSNNEKVELLCTLLATHKSLLHQKIEELKAVLFKSYVNILVFHPVPLTDAFGLEFPTTLLPDTFFFDSSNKLQVDIFERVTNTRATDTTKSNNRSKSVLAAGCKLSTISATEMRQLQPDTKQSLKIFQEGRNEGEIKLFDDMVRLAVHHVTKDEAIKQAELKKKIAFLFTVEHQEQAPHRDFPPDQLEYRRRTPIAPWGLDMPITSSGLLLNVWPTESLSELKRLKNDKSKDPTLLTPKELCMPYTLDVAFRQVLLFAGRTVHGGGFQRCATTTTTAAPLSNRHDENRHSNRGDGNQEATTTVTTQKRMIPANNNDGCFRMHMHLSFATTSGSRGGTHGALEGQNQVHLYDDEDKKFSDYLLKSDNSRF